MKLKLILVLLLLVFISSISSIASAQSMTEAQRQALIAQIQQQIAILTQQLQQMLAQRQGTAAWCYTFNNNLGYVNSGSTEVVNLHIALQREGISYSPDDISTYFTGTSKGAIQFQAKYGISPQTGYVGPKTRTKLNQLYGCNTNLTTCTPYWSCGSWTACYNNSQTRTCNDSNNCGTLIGKPSLIQSCATTCAPNWSCGDWGLCLSGQHTRTCADSNNCGITTNKPSESGICTQQPAVKIQVNNSDGPVNIFLTSGNGANVNSSGLSLTKSINLQWTGVDVLSCAASDSLTPTIFSGYKPSSSSQTVTLSGNIQSASSYNNKVSDTFKITCVSTATGYQVSDSVTVNLFYTVSGNCSPYWQCGSWGTCSNSQHTRNCTDYNGCGSLVGKPSESEPCTSCTPYWQIGAWSACVNGHQTRTVTDSNNCGVAASDATTQSCTCTPSWLTGAWSACTDINSQQTRTVTDLNNCGTTVNEPTVTQPCTSCAPNWQTGTWSACVNNQQTRTVTDSNNCGVTTNKPTTTENCVIGVTACADSDGGIDYYTKGTLTTDAPYWASSVSDSCGISVGTGAAQHTQSVSSCSGDNCYISEYSCNGNAPTSSGPVKCPNGSNGCADGACIRAASLNISQDILASISNAVAKIAQEIQAMLNK